MSGRFGIILLDGDEIILRIYIIGAQGSWKLLRYQTYDLSSTSPNKLPTSSEFVEVIAEVLLARYSSAILDWKICGRNLENNILYDISVATGLESEMLTLAREQELLCKGILMEIQ